MRRALTGNTDKQDTDPVGAVTPSLHYNMLYSTKSGPSQNTVPGKNFLLVHLSLPCRGVMLDSCIPDIRDSLQLTPALPPNIPLL